MNSNISSLQKLMTTLQGSKFIQDVKPLTENGKEVGYKINLSDGSVLNVYHGKNGKNGADGIAPQIGVKKDSGDGKYYWVLDGKWILDNDGKKMPVTPEDGKNGITPEIKVENSKWYVSYDGGITWKELGNAVDDDTLFFKDITYADGVLKFIFTDGDVLSFTVGSTFKIVLGEYDLSSGNTEIEIPYTVVGAIGEVSVFTALVHSHPYGDLADFFGLVDIIEETAYTGKIIIYRDWAYSREETKGKLGIFAVDESGKTISKVINLTTGILYSEEDKYCVGSKASQMMIKLSTNRKYEVETSADWISYVETKVVEEKVLVFDVKENTGSWRNAEIYVTSGKKKIVLTISQKPSENMFFYVNHKCKLFSSSERYSLDPIGNSKNILYNNEGKTVAEVLGYGSWEEMVQSGLTAKAYDCFTGKPYEKTDTWDYFHFDENGKVVDSHISTYLNFYGNNTSENIEYPYFDMGLGRYAIGGKSYTFGIQLSSNDKTVYIEITLDVEEYIDPEEGLYENPAAPGTYEFNLTDVIDLSESDSKQWQVEHTEAWEKIKETLGMTAYEIYLNEEKSNYRMEFIDPECYGSRLELDASSNVVYTGDYLIRIDYSNWVLHNRINKIRLLPKCTWKGSKRDWTPEVYAAAENETVINYKFRFIYTTPERSTYNIIFNHEIKFKKGEQTL